MWEIVSEGLREVTIYLSAFYPLLYLAGFTRNSKAFKYFTIYLLIIGFIQVSMKYYNIVTTGESNLFFFIYYFVLQFIMLSLFYRELLGYKWINVITVFTLFIVAYQYFTEPELYFKYNPIGSSITQLIVVIYSILYLYKSLTGKREFLIVNVGLLVYLLSSLLIFAAGNLALNDSFPEYISKSLTELNLVLFLIFQILIVVEWFRNYRVIKNIK
ncbi:MAG: hypothetical protein ACI9M9_001458 [Flavobacteriaceae bacterium]|jgi:hypothetical protein